MIDQDRYTLLLFGSSCVAVVIYLRSHSGWLSIRVGAFLILTWTLLFAVSATAAPSVDSLLTEPTNPVLLRVFDRPPEQPRDQVDPFAYPRRDHGRIVPDLPDSVEDVNP